MVQNKIKKDVQENSQNVADTLCVYKAGENEVKLTPNFVKQFLVTGNPENVSYPEVVMFMNLCKFQQLNPFLREAYLIKYGKETPASLVVGKAAFEARADRDERYEGYDAGIVVQRQDGTLEYRKGTLLLDNEVLVGGWAEVYVKGYVKPVYAAVSLSEYHTGKSTWNQKPATMIRKVAKVQALREAFPNALSGLYVAEELGHSDEELPIAPIEQPTEENVVVDIPEPTPVTTVEPNILDGSDLLI